MQSKTNFAMGKEEYKYYNTLDERYDDIIEYSESCENKLKYGYFMTDQDLINYIDNYYLEMKDNYERYDIEYIFYNYEIKEDKKGKYIVSASGPNSFSKCC